jgi:hypothetical protein
LRYRCSETLASTIKDSRDKRNQQATEYRRQHDADYYFCHVDPRLRQRVVPTLSLRATYANAEPN